MEFIKNFPNQKHLETLIECAPENHTIFFNAPEMNKFFVKFPNCIVFGDIKEQTIFIKLNELQKNILPIFQGPKIDLDDLLDRAINDHREKNFSFKREIQPIIQSTLSSAARINSTSWDALQDASNIDLLVSDNKILAPCVDLRTDTDSKVKNLLFYAKRGYTRQIHGAEVGHPVIVNNDTKGINGSSNTVNLVLDLVDAIHIYSDDRTPTLCFMDDQQFEDILNHARYYFNEVRKPPKPTRFIVFLPDPRLDEYQRIWGTSLYTPDVETRHLPMGIETWADFYKDLNND